MILMCGISVFPC